MRQACQPWLRTAVYHWARVATQHDARSRARYAELRKRGHSHGRALRSVADRLLAIACAMLRTGIAFDPERPAARPATP
jgi:transposase